jgi:hypothetical protein
VQQIRENADVTISLLPYTRWDEDFLADETLRYYVPRGQLRPAGRIVEKFCTDPIAEQHTKKLEQLVGKTERPLEGGTTAPGKEAEAKLDSHEQVITSSLVQIADLSKRIKAIEKK